jgi:hypothetical protein
VNDDWRTGVVFVLVVELVFANSYPSPRFYFWKLRETGAANLLIHLELLYLFLFFTKRIALILINSRFNILKGLNVKVRLMGKR